MPIPSDATLRTKIGAVIELTAPKAVMFPYWILGFDETQWPGLLKSSADLGSDSQPRTHGYVIIRQGSDGEIIDLCRTRRFYSYLILGLHYYSTGTEANNSEKLFSAEVDAISQALEARTTLDADLGGIEPVNWKFNLKSYGGQLLHVASGALTLRICDTV